MCWFALSPRKDKLTLPQPLFRNVVAAAVQSHQENDPSTVFVMDLFSRIDSLLIPDQPAIVETTLNAIGKIARCGNYLLEMFD